MPGIEYIAMVTGFALILIGFYGALTNRNLLRMIVLAFAHFMLRPGRGVVPGHDTQRDGGILPRNKEISRPVMPPC